MLTCPHSDHDVNLTSFPTFFTCPHSDQDVNNFPITTPLSITIMMLTSPYHEYNVKKSPYHTHGRERRASSKYVTVTLQHPAPPWCGAIWH
ncbi:hypothetical protein PoB_004696500 [Plakobranchus ocellatus]|uniref:Uncharacterized protein n=1 Tax=Plakobranchus ocellatus TaxID=259542 RepID=A0AAV4BN50_9GAST|nr:hypothetical protein PoB_004696500 [Plakobranchus ocellatus]